MNAKTIKKLKKRVAEMKAIQVRIGKERDKLREIKDEVENLLSPIEQGYDDIDTISQVV
jgi:hypothetical protein